MDRKKPQKCRYIEPSLSRPLVEVSVHLILKTYAMHYPSCNAKCGSNFLVAGTVCCPNFLSVVKSVDDPLKIVARVCDAGTQSYTTPGFRYLKMGAD